MKKRLLRDAMYIALLCASAHSIADEGDAAVKQSLAPTPTEQSPSKAASSSEPSLAATSNTDDEDTITYNASNWCKEKSSVDFAIVTDDFAGFHLKKGTLTGNVERFVSLMYPESNGFISKVGRHLVPSDLCIVAQSPNHILQSIIEPYYIGNVPVYFASFKNDFHALFYKDDDEFVRYRIGVRR